MRLLAAIALCCMAGFVAAQPVEVFGFKVGEPIGRNIRACNSEPNLTDDYCTSSGYVVGAVPSDRRVSLNIPWKETAFALPKWVRRDNYRRLELYTDSTGNVIGLEADTAGPESQDMIIDAIEQKFGAPTKKVYKEVGNAYGAKWKEANVLWLLPDGAEVYFYCYSATTCAFKIGTKERVVERNLELEKRKQQNRL